MKTARQSPLMWSVLLFFFCVVVAWPAPGRRLVQARSHEQDFTGEGEARRADKSGDTQSAPRSSSQQQQSLVLFSLFNGDIEAVDGLSGEPKWRIAGTEPSVSSWSAAGWPELIPGLDGSLYQIVDDGDVHMERVALTAGSIVRENGMTGIVVSRVEVASVLVDAVTGEVIRTAEWGGTADLKSHARAFFAETDDSDSGHSTRSANEFGRNILTFTKTFAGIRIVDVATGELYVNASLLHLTPSLVTDETCLPLAASAPYLEAEDESSAISFTQDSADFEVWGEIDRSQSRFVMRSGKAGEMLWSRDISDGIVEAQGIHGARVASSGSSGLGIATNVDMQSFVEPHGLVRVRQANGQLFVDSYYPDAIPASTDFGVFRLHASESSTSSSFMLSGGSGMYSGRESRPLGFPGGGGGSMDGKRLKPLEEPMRLDKFEMQQRTIKARFSELLFAAVLGALLVMTPVGLAAHFRRRKSRKMTGSARETPSRLSSMPKSSHQPLSGTKQHSQSDILGVLSTSLDDEMTRDAQLTDLQLIQRDEGGTHETSLMSSRSRKGKKQSKKRNTDHERPSAGSVTDPQTAQYVSNAAGSRHAEPVNVSGGLKVGRIVVSSDVIGYGTQGTVVFRGKLFPEERHVAVKRLLKEFYGSATREIALLIELEQSGGHVVRYFAMEEDKEFIYLALELCTRSLADAVDTCILPALQHDYQNTGLGVPRETLGVLKDVLMGLSELHSHGIVHRDLKPHNVLISEVSVRNKSTIYCAKVGDVGLATRLQGDRSSFSQVGTVGAGSTGWRAPEVLLGAAKLTKAVDIFSAGCLIFHVLTKGQHPFGELVFERDMNITKGRADLAPLRRIRVPEAEHLVRQMISAAPEDRPTVELALLHPFFWSDTVKLNFICDVSDRLLNESGWRSLSFRSRGASSYTSLMLSSPDAYDRCIQRLDMMFLAHLGRSYNSSLTDLVRMIRNKRNHYLEFPPNVQALVGPIPLEGEDSEHNYMRYFTTRFPNLVMDLYLIVRSLADVDQHFERYGLYSTSPTCAPSAALTVPAGATPEDGRDTVHSSPSRFADVSRALENGGRTGRYIANSGGSSSFSSLRDRRRTDHRDSTVPLASGSRTHPFGASSKP
ncbi:Serine/threonine-protein kinase/endoribonuclease IRE1 [Porphyridium purpureum]|uniref:non-specific serine/threonine protein kinase n=1 Tax=Porphyridium purpureum TaxID=35688 RepID=A0A5J4YZU5_PORPP|nr:Serine/threonine-protein kinase/endoribonuclease IRE1 [Porphyridium purpureum]|eukprot:POR7850..scf209_3